MLKSRAEILSEVSLWDCPIHQATEEYNIRIMDLDPMCIFSDIPNYLVENLETGRIDFANDSLELCRHFVQLYSTDRAKQVQGLSSDTPGPETPLN